MSNVELKLIYEDSSGDVVYNVYVDNVYAGGLEANYDPRINSFYIENIKKSDSYKAGHLLEDVVNYLYNDKGYDLGCLPLEKYRGYYEELGFTPFIHNGDDIFYHKIHGRNAMKSDEFLTKSKKRCENINENIVDKICSVELPFKDRFIEYVDLYPIDDDLIDVQFVAKDENGVTMPIYVANGVIDKIDGEWNTYPQVKWNVSHLNDTEKAYYIMDEFAKFKSEKDFKLEELRKEIVRKLQGKNKMKTDEFLTGLKNIINEDLKKSNEAYLDFGEILEKANTADIKIKLNADYYVGSVDEWQDLVDYEKEGDFSYETGSVEGFERTYNDLLKSGALYKKGDDLYLKAGVQILLTSNYNENDIRFKYSMPGNSFSFGQIVAFILAGNKKLQWPTMDLWLEGIDAEILE